MCSGATLVSTAWKFGSWVTAERCTARHFTKLDHDPFGVFTQPGSFAPILRCPNRVRFHSKGGRYSGHRTVRLRANKRHDALRTGRAMVPALPDASIAPAREI